MKKYFLLTFLTLINAIAFAQNSFENLGALVNSKNAELRPTISADGRTLYYIVSNDENNVLFKSDKKIYQDVWYSTIDNKGVWSKSKKCDSVINQTNRNAIFWCSADGNRLLIRGTYQNGKYYKNGFSFINKKIFSSNNEVTWTSPEEVKIKGYENLSVDQYSGVFMTNDGKTMVLYFSEEKNSLLNDLYVSHLESDGSWTMPKKIKNGINTDDYDEISPFVAVDGLTMYFSSDRPGGFGKYDIWMTKRLDETWMNWSEPQNMGETINTNEWDAYFSIDAKGEYGYMVNSKNSLGESDIVKVKIPESLRPNNVMMVYGKIYNALSKLPMNGKLFYDLVPGEKSEGNAIAFVDGSFKVALPYGKKYSIRAMADNYLSVIDTLDLTKFEPYKEIHRDLYLNPVFPDGIYIKDSAGNIVRKNIDSIKKEIFENPDAVKEGEIYTTNNILFDFGKSILRADSYKELDKIVKMMKANNTMQIELSAHTDNIGGYCENLKLSTDRANAAKQYLLSKGFDESRVIAKGLGETTPITSNKTEQGRQLNRRIEFRILKK